MGLYVCTYKPILTSKKLEVLSLEITQTGELVIFLCSLIHLLFQVFKIKKRCYKLKKPLVRVAFLNYCWIRLNDPVPDWIIKFTTGSDPS